MLVHLVARSQRRSSIEDRVLDTLAKVQGAYSLLFMTEDTIIAVRDPMGHSPALPGDLPGNKDAHVVASEPTAFDLIGAEFVRDVEPGEMIVIDGAGMRSLRARREGVPPKHMCVFEYVYFARPDSRIGGRSVYEVRKASAKRSRRSTPSRPTSSSRCPTPACPRASATRRRSGSRSRWG